MRSQNVLRDLEQVIDHQRSGIGLLGQVDLGRFELRHALGVEGVGFGIEMRRDPQRERVETRVEHFAGRCR